MKLKLVSRGGFSRSAVLCGWTWRQEALGKSSAGSTRLLQGRGSCGGLIFVCWLFYFFCELCVFFDCCCVLCLLDRKEQSWYSCLAGMASAPSMICSLPSRCFDQVLTKATLAQLVGIGRYNQLWPFTYSMYSRFLTLTIKQCPNYQRGLLKLRGWHVARRKNVLTSQKCLHFASRMSIFWYSTHAMNIVGSLLKSVSSEWQTFHLFHWYFRK